MFKRLREDIAVICTRDPAARGPWDAFLNSPGLHAVWWHRLAHRFWCWRMRGMARFISTLARFLTGVEIHPGARIGRRFFIDHGMGVVIGETAVIGDDCSIYHGVTLGGTAWAKGTKRHPNLEAGVIIGAGAKVLGPITIGAGARIGANSVVVKPVAAECTVVGLPARAVMQCPEVDAKRRDAMRAKMGFDAYGMVENMRDPVAHAIAHMLDHMHAMEQKMAVISEAMKNAGVALEDIEIPELHASEFASFRRKSGDKKA